MLKGHTHRCHMHPCILPRLQYCRGLQDAFVYMFLWLSEIQFQWKGYIRKCPSCHSLDLPRLQYCRRLQGSVDHWCWWLSGTLWKQIDHIRKCHSCQEELDKTKLHQFTSTGATYLVCVIIIFVWICILLMKLHEFNLLIQGG